MTDRIKQIHLWTGAIVAGFLVLHFGSHLTAWGGIALHTQGLALVRSVYRVPVVEALLIAALLLQILLGLCLVIGRIRSGGLGGWGVLQALSGVLLAMFILAHTGASLSARFAYGLDTNFYWPAGTLVTSPMNQYFYFHYTVPICALFAHLGCALRFNGRKRLALCALAAGPVAAAVIVLPFSGALYPIELPASHAAYLDAVIAPNHKLVEQSH